MAIHPDRRGSGCGTAITRYVEEELAREGARILLIETSGVESFERARAFYRRIDYTEEARVDDDYGPGDDKVVFGKSLAVG